MLPCTRLRASIFLILFWGSLVVVTHAPNLVAQNSPPYPPNTRAVPIIAPAARSGIYAKMMPSNAGGIDNPISSDYPTLVFDTDTKQYDAKPGDAIAPFTFYLTNVWTNEVVIDRVHASCGCTTAHIPPTPWHIPPGGKGEVAAQVNLAGKMGLVQKTLTFYTSVGNRILTLKVKIPPAGTAMEKMSPTQRKAAMALSAADPQAIFRGECAKCHVDQGAGLKGESLYAADCGICHESSHRDSVVPDLHALKHPTDLAYWNTFITYGKPHSMMPGFATTQGGPLSYDQISSLAVYLDHTISHHLSSAIMTNASAALSVPHAP